MPRYNYSIVLRMLAPIIDLIIPPRGSERLVRELKLSQLQSLEQEDGLPYRDPRVTSLVWELKYYRSRRAAALAGALLAEKILAAAAEELGTPLLVPVPMHASRRKERGHNQTEVLCEAALKELRKTSGKKVLGSASPQPDFFSESFAPVEYAPHALARVRATHTQQGLERSTRLKNVKGSMRARPEAVRERVCIVVDDVATTGATLAEAKRALRHAGARAVRCIVLARS